MGLRRLAETDLAAIVQDSATGFGWPLVLTSPDKTSSALTGLCNDISSVIDPETGMIVSGRTAAIALVISDLDAKGIGRPVGIADVDSDPWSVVFDDINGVSHKFKIKETNPDRALGLLVCFLEAFE